MNVTATKCRLFLVAMFAMGTWVSAAESGGQQSEPVKPAAKSETATKDRSKEAAAKAKESVRTSSEEAKAEIQKIIDEHTKLAQALKEAAPEKRDEILARMNERMKAFQERQDALHKQMRDEMRRQRSTTPPKR